MTKAAVRRQYEQFLERQSEKLLEATREEFGGGIVGRIAGAGGEAVLRRIESDMRQQGRVVVDRAAAIAAGDSESYERAFLETNPVYQRYDGDEREELRRHLLDHFKAVSRDLAPLVASDREDFWAALEAEYDHDEAVAIVDRHFSQAETFKRYRDGVFSREFVAEKAIAIVDRAESRLRAELNEKLDRLYDR